LLRRSFGAVLTVIVASVCIRAFIFYDLGLQNDPWTYRFFPSELVFFLFGNISYRLYRKGIKNDLFRRYGYLGLLFLLVFSVSFSRLPAFSFRIFHFSFWDVSYLFSVMFSLPAIFIFFKNVRMDNWIGELSYPVYLSHLLVAKICGINAIPALNNSLSIALITLFISALLIRFLVVPLDAFRQKRLRSYKTMSMAVTPVNVTA
jgi:peptidoglycan/LPS O-acetylase OafA/YrhL